MKEKKLTCAHGELAVEKAYVRTRSLSVEGHSGTRLVVSLRRARGVVCRSVRVAFCLSKVGSSRAGLLTQSVAVKWPINWRL